MLSFDDSALDLAQNPTTRSCGGGAIAVTGAQRPLSAILALKLDSNDGKSADRPGRHRLSAGACGGGSAPIQELTALQENRNDVTNRLSGITVRLGRP